MHAFRSVIAKAPRFAKLAAGSATVGGVAFATGASAPAQVRQTPCALRRVHAGWGGGYWVVARAEVSRGVVSLPCSSMGWGWGK